MVDTGRFRVAAAPGATFVMILGLKGEADRWGGAPNGKPPRPCGASRAACRRGAPPCTNPPRPAHAPPLPRPCPAPHERARPNRPAPPLAPTRRATQQGDRGVQPVTTHFRVRVLHLALEGDGLMPPKNTGRWVFCLRRAVVRLGPCPCASRRCGLSRRGPRVTFSAGSNPPPLPLASRSRMNAQEGVDTFVFNTCEDEATLARARPAQAVVLLRAHVCIRRHLGAATFKPPGDKPFRAPFSCAPDPVKHPIPSQTAPRPSQGSSPTA